MNAFWWAGDGGSDTEGTSSVLLPCEPLVARTYQHPPRRGSAGYSIPKRPRAGELLLQVRAPLPALDPLTDVIPTRLATQGQIQEPRLRFFARGDTWFARWGYRFDDLASVRLVGCGVVDPHGAICWAELRFPEGVRPDEAAWLAGRPVDLARADVAWAGRTSGGLVGHDGGGRPRPVFLGGRWSDRASWREWWIPAAASATWDSLLGLPASARARTSLAALIDALEELVEERPELGASFDAAQHLAVACAPHLDDRWPRRKDDSARRDG